MRLAALAVMVLMLSGCSRDSDIVSLGTRPTSPQRQQRIEECRLSLTRELVSENILDQGFEWPPSKGPLARYLEVESRLGIHPDAHKGVCIALADQALSLPGVSAEWGERLGAPHELVLRDPATGEELCAPLELALELELKHRDGYLVILDAALREALLGAPGPR